MRDMENTTQGGSPMFQIVAIYADGSETTWSVRDTEKGAKIALANARRNMSKYGFASVEIREISPENRNLSAAWSV
jgi:hypothetical protein